MNRIQGLIADALDWSVHFLTQTLPPWLWEHKMWLIAFAPLVGAYALYKYLGE